MTKFVLLETAVPRAIVSFVKSVLVMVGGSTTGSPSSGAASSGRLNSEK